jgi:hypothetical protein
MFCAVFVLYAVLSLKYKQHLAGDFLIGLWLLSPLFIATSFSYYGGGFSKAAGSTIFSVALATVFPLITLYMAGVDQTIAALTAATVFLFLLRRLERRSALAASHGA